MISALARRRLVSRLFRVIRGRLAIVVPAPL